jgi:hypothetical protein
MVAMDSDEPEATKEDQCREKVVENLENKSNQNLENSGSGPGMDFDAFIDQEYDCHNDFDMCIRPVVEVGSAGRLMLDLLKNMPKEGANIMTEKAMPRKDND